MDLSKLTKSDQILFGAGLVFLISTFLEWFSFSIAGFSAGGSGWDVGFLWGRLPFFIVLAMIIWVAVRRFGLAKLPAEIPPLYLVGGGLVALLVLLKLIIGESGLSRSYGLYIATVAALGVGFAGFLKFQEGGGDLDTLKSQMKAKANEMGDNMKKDGN